MALGTLEGYGAVVIAEYARSVFVSGLAWTILGLAVVVTPSVAMTLPELIPCNPQLPHTEGGNIEFRVGIITARCIAAAVGCMIIAGNAPYVIAPQAEAIRMLLRTVGG